MSSAARIAVCIILTCTASCVFAADPAVVSSEFIFDKAPFKSCHASTIAQTPDGLVAAWFGGTAEGKPDVGIWVARRDATGWSTPIEVATGTDATGKRVPCWNPVLYQSPGGPLILFYKVSGSIKTWWGMMTTSTDGGKSWAVHRRLPDGFLGPIKDKPIRLADGSLLCPTSDESNGWRVYMESTPDLGVTWQKTGFLNDGTQLAAIQPTVLDHGPAGLQLLCRTKQGKIGQSWSTDGGKTWGPIELTSLPNPNSGIDAVQLKDGRSLLIYNHTAKGRSPLNLAISTDGKTWQAGPVLESEKGEYSYPAIIQTADGLVHATYTWKREKIRHVVIDPTKLVPAAPLGE
jgi:predicted neuraminidase